MAQHSFSTQAAREGLTLKRSRANTSGYKGVAIHKRSKSKPYQALIKQGGEKQTRLLCEPRRQHLPCRPDKKRNFRGIVLESPEALRVRTAEAVRRANEEGLAPERAKTRGLLQGVTKTRDGRAGPM